MARQQRMLSESLAFLIGFSATYQAGDYLKQVCRRHASDDLAISPTLFDTWMDCLVDALAQVDPGYSDTVATAWRVVLGPGLAFMKHGP